jgi:hypothetical protein
MVAYPNLPLGDRAVLAFQPRLDAQETAALEAAIVGCLIELTCLTNRPTPVMFSPINPREARGDKSDSSLQCSTGLSDERRIGRIRPRLALRDHDIQESRIVVGMCGIEPLAEPADVLAATI